MFKRFIEKMVERSVATVVEQSFKDPVFIARIDDIVQKSPVIRFINAGQLELLRAFPDMMPKEAWQTMVDATLDFLKDEGIKFNDTGYDWSEDAGRVIARENVIECG